MTSITKDQATKWDTHCDNGFHFDTYHYILWGDKEVHKIIVQDDSRTEIRICYHNDYETRKSPNGQEYRVHTGKYVPVVCVDRWKRIKDSDMFTSVSGSDVHDMSDKFGVQNKKSYSVLQKISNFLTDSELASMNII